MTDGELPESHPRYQSLLTRHRIEEGVKAGITSRQGLIAQGRGEAFDYLLGERTISSAREAERVAAAHLLLAEHPVLSINGNAAALCPGELIELADVSGAALEVNLFNRTPARIQGIAEHLYEYGAEEVLGLTADAHIPGIEHERAKIDADGIGKADVVFVPLEDGDRAEALAAMGKTELVVDLNPMSRSARSAAVPIVDNILRAVPNMTESVHELQEASHGALQTTIETFDPEVALTAAEQTIRSVTEPS
jgi:4-phosphopantoate--beta-alanine ligase